MALRIATIAVDPPAAYSFGGDPKRDCFENTGAEVPLSEVRASDRTEARRRR